MLRWILSIITPLPSSRSILATTISFCFASYDRKFRLKYISPILIPEQLLLLLFSSPFTIHSRHHQDAPLSHQPPIPITFSPSPQQPNRLLTGDVLLLTVVAGVEAGGRCCASRLLHSSSSRWMLLNQIISKRV